MNTDLQYCVAFTRIPSLGPARFQLLQQHFGTLERAWNASAAELKATGLGQAVVTTVVSQRPKIDPSSEMERLERAGIQALTLDQPGYPTLLKEIYDLPPVLYVKGTLLPEDQRSIAVVGTRKASAYGREAAFHLTTDLTRAGVTIVSGLARGMDSIAHRSALDAGGRTIAVLASGLDTIYPPEHAPLASEIIQNGALVSEHPLGVRPVASNFPRRNRIMSGMTLGTLVIEAARGSGAIWTVRHALEQNREVMCVPGSIFSPNSSEPNLLIQQGAKLVMDYTDVLEKVNLTRVGEQLPMEALIRPTDDTEAAVLDHISYDPIHIDEVGRLMQLPSSTISSTLALMEIKGLIRQVGAMNYVRMREVPAGYGGGA